MSDLSEGSEKLSQALYYHSLGRDKEALQSIKSACKSLDRALDQEYKEGTGATKQVSDLLKRGLAVYDGLKAGKQVLNIPTKLVYISSNVGKYVIFPWNYDPCMEEFEIGSFDDQDGRLAMSIEQEKLFTSWKRPNEALGCESPIMTNDGAERLYQDRLQDCSVVASLLSIVSWEKRTGGCIIGDRMYPKLPSNDNEHNHVPMVSNNGRYMVKLLINGTERKVIIDDYLPFSSTGERLFVSSTKSPVLWPALMEKAYMKVMGGYDFIGSHAARDTFALTGWIPEYIYLRGHLELYNDSRDKLWTRLQRGWKNGDLMICIGTGNLSGEETETVGLVPNHDYTVIDMKVDENTGQRIMLVNNPWKKDTRGETSSIPHIALEDRTDVGDGDFWIDYHSICLWFQSIYLNWNPNLFPYKEHTHFLWNQEAFQRSQDTKTFITYPQYTITSSSDQETLVTLLLSKHFFNNPNQQTDDYSDADAEDNGFISLTLYESKYKVLTPDEKPLFVRGPSMNTSYHTLRFTMPPQTTYTIVIAATDMEVRSSSSRFTLNVYSTQQLELTKAPEFFKHKTSVSGEWSRTSAGGSWSHSTYSINPQFKLIVPRSVEKYKLLLASDTNYPINIHLFWNKGRQVRGYNQKSVVGSSGKYRVSNCVADGMNLEAGEYTVVVSMFDQNTHGGFELYAFGTSPVELQPITPETAGLFSRSVLYNWDGTNRIEIAITVKYDCSAQVHLQTTEEDEEERNDHGARRPSAYRPHLRISVFDGPNLLASEGFSDTIYGLYIDRVKLKAYKQYTAVVERMEVGYGSFRLFFYSNTPVEFDQKVVV